MQRHSSQRDTSLPESHVASDQGKKRDMSGGTSLTRGQSRSVLGVPLQFSFDSPKGQSVQEEGEGTRWWEGGCRLSTDWLVYFHFGKASASCKLSRFQPVGLLIFNCCLNSDLKMGNLGKTGTWGRNSPYDVMGIIQAWT